MTTRTVLAGDIGGTHARLARFEVADGPDPTYRLVDEWTADSPDYDGPATIVRRYLEARRLTPTDLDGVCVAIAGPIRDGTLHVPNLGWTLDTKRFGDEIGVPGATLINDFAAIGHGVLALDATDYEEIQDGSAKEAAPVAVLGPGTGLGHAFLIWEAGSYHVYPSEGGHVDFAARNETEWALAEHLRRRYGHASWERVVSGHGLLDVYRFLAQREPAAESEHVRLEIDAGDGPAVISHHGTRRTDALCSEALALFVSSLGTVAGNIALTLEAYGGVYIAGGIAPRIVDALKAGPFLDAFRAKGRVSELLEDVPVRVVLDERVGLRGAARVAARGR
jgi:glucokinase